MSNASKPPSIGPETMTASLEGVARLAADLRSKADVLAAIASTLVGALRDGCKVLTCGNGGSAAEALHLAEELVGRFQSTVNRRPLPAVCLCADPTALTCIANDFGFEHVFARQVEAHGQAGDVLVALSTSGKSPSILNALRRAREIGVLTIGLLGPPGSPAESLCDRALLLPGHAAARVQEAHLIAIHLFLEQIDREFGDGSAR